MSSHRWRTAPPRRVPSAGWPIVGALLIATGLGGVATQRSEIGIAAVTIIVVVGAVLLIPLIIGVVARSSGRLPLPVRLAVRDADRQRGRSTPAIAAIMASMSAVTALAIASSSDEAQREQSMTYVAPIGAVTLAASTATMDAAVSAAEKVSGARFTPLPTLSDETGERTISAMVPDARYEGSSTGADVAVADAKVLRGWGVSITPAQQAELDRGGALVARETMLRRGNVRLQDFAPDTGASAPVVLPAVAADLRMGGVPQGPEPIVAGAVVSPATAQRLGLPVSVRSARADRSASRMDVGAVRQAVIAAAPEAGDVDVSRVYKSTYGVVFAILGILGALAIALGTFSATGLALSDARRDLATLVAVGASPRSRRLVAGRRPSSCQSSAPSTGVVVGFVPGLAAARTLTRFGQFGDSAVIDVPWSLLAILVVAVPLVVAGLTALVSRGRPPLDAGGIA